MSNEDAIHIRIEAPKQPGVFIIETPDDFEALVRDARRFRRMEVAHEKPLRDGSLYGWCYGSGVYGWMLQNKPLAEIADALPEVEQK